MRMRCAAAIAVLVMTRTTAWCVESGVDLFPVIQGGKWGYMDKTGRMAIKPQYDCAWDFSDGLACVQVGLLRGYIDEKNTMVIKPQYVMAKPFCNGKASVYINGGKWGSFVLFNYDLYQAGGKWVEISKPEGVAGNVVARNQGQPAPAPEQLVPVSAIFDVNDPALTATWTKLSKYGLGKAPGMDQRLWGTNFVPLADSDSVPFLATKTFTFDVTAPAAAGKYDFKWQMCVQPNVMFGESSSNIVVTVGDTASKSELFKLRAVSEGKEGAKLSYAPVTNAPPGNGAKFVSVEVPLRMVTGRVYSVSITVQNTGPAVRKWGYTDKAGVLKAEMKYDGAKPLSGGIAAVRLGSKWGCIDRAGKLVAECNYDFIAQCSEGMIRVVSGSKHGYLDCTGKAVVEPKFDCGWEFNKGLARVLTGRKEGYIDHSGKYVWEPGEDSWPEPLTSVSLSR